MGACEGVLVSAAAVIFAAPTLVYEVSAAATYSYGWLRSSGNVFCRQQLFFSGDLSLCVSVLIGMVFRVQHGSSSSSGGSKQCIVGILLIPLLLC